MPAFYFPDNITIIKLALYPICCFAAQIARLCCIKSIRHKNLQKHDHAAYQESNTDHHKNGNQLLSLT